MKEKAGSMGAGMAFLFAIGGGLLGGGVAMLASGWLGIGLLCAGSFLATFLTKAGKGAGIGASILGTLALTVMIAAGVMMAASSAASEVTTEEGGELAAAAVGGLGLFAAILSSAVFFIAGLVSSIIATIMGASFKAKALEG